MTAIVCSDPLHASRSASPGFEAVLGSVPAGQTPPSGMLCGACATAMIQSAALDPNGPSNGILIQKDGTVLVYEWTYYPGGTPCRPVIARTTVAALIAGGAITVADRDAVLPVLVRIRNAMAPFLT